MTSLHKLTTALSSLPGIGPRQAKRLAYHLLLEKRDAVPTIHAAFAELDGSQRRCSLCRSLFFDSHEYCEVCRDSSRDPGLLMIVTSDIEKENIESMKIFNGQYFVLGHTMSIVEDDPSAVLPMQELTNRLTKNGEGVREVVLALSSTPEEEHTAETLKTVLTSLATEHSFTVSMLGRGLSTGTELEYSDAETLKNAFSNRK